MEIAEICRVFRSHGFLVTYFEASEDAAAYLARECAGKTVSFGGSVTLEQLGLFDACTATGADVCWHWKNGGKVRPESEVFVTSANALSETGEIVNIDGRGNRVAAAIFGGHTCFTVCGMNKLEPTLEDAVRRAREVAAPKNAQRLHCDTPCAQDGSCHDCRSPARICRALSILMAPPVSFTRYELVLVGQELGY